MGRIGDEARRDLRSGVVPPVELICSDCGYGAVVRGELPDCRGRTRIGLRDGRRTRNEAASADLDRQNSSAETPRPFLCECDGRDCRTVVWLTLTEYDTVRGVGDSFIVAPGHQLLVRTGR